MSLITVKSGACFSMSCHTITIWFISKTGQEVSPPTFTSTELSSFREINILLLNPKIVLVEKNSENPVVDVAKKLKIKNFYTYGTNVNANFNIVKIIQKKLNSKFNVVVRLPGKKKFLIHNVSIPLLGHHNIRNATAAIAAALCIGIPIKTIKEGLLGFKGVQRRFNKLFEFKGAEFFDDYAHHPTEIDRLHQAVQQLYPNDEIAILFQPHLFSRTRDFMTGFAQSLQAFDHVGILPIYPARESAIPGVTSGALCEQIEHAVCLNEDDALSWLTQHRARVKLIVGAGDIDRLVTPAENELKKQCDGLA